MSDHLSSARLQRGAEHLHTLGPRAIAEFLAALTRKIGGEPAALGLMAEYQRITPGMIRAAGAERCPPRTVRLVPREARQ